MREIKTAFSSSMCKALKTVLGMFLETLQLTDHVHFPSQFVSLNLLL